jgi:hypothetical protein
MHLPQANAGAHHQLLVGEIPVNALACDQQRLPAGLIF